MNCNTLFNTDRSLFTVSNGISRVGVSCTPELNVLDSRDSCAITSARLALHTGMGLDQDSHRSSSVPASVFLRLIRHSESGARTKKRSVYTLSDSTTFRKTSQYLNNI